MTNSPSKSPTHVPTVAPSRSPITPYQAQDCHGDGTTFDLTIIALLFLWTAALLSIHYFAPGGGKKTATGIFGLILLAAGLGTWIPALATYNCFNHLPANFHGMVLVFVIPLALVVILLVWLISGGNKSGIKPGV